MRTIDPIQMLKQMSSELHARTRLDKKVVNLDESQYQLLASLVLSGYRETWFADQDHPPVDATTARLLFNIYLAEKTNVALSKKQASTLLGVGDLKTARKAILRAQQMELLEIVRSETDGRTDLLKLTSTARTLIEQSLFETLNAMRIAMHILLQFGLPDTGAPVLRSATGLQAGSATPARKFPKPQQHHPDKQEQLMRISAAKQRARKMARALKRKANDQGHKKNKIA